MKIFNNKKYKIAEDEKYKIVIGDNYSCTFNKINGFTIKSGNTPESDPGIAPLPEILDIEISSGKCRGSCPHCYKSNGQQSIITKHMSLNTFQQIMDRFCVGNNIHCLNQLSLGLTDTTSNPDFWNILEECRNRGIIPNYTTHSLDITPEIAEKTSKLCGAVAVSMVNKEKAYDAVQMFTDAGMKQVNIHFTLYKERFNEALDLIEDVSGNDSRLSKLNAIVFLQYKPKGRNVGEFTSLTYDEFSLLIDYAGKQGIPFGLDSCSCRMYEKTLENKEDKEQLLSFCERCESTIGSMYISVDGVFFPCSFAEGEKDWVSGIHVLDYDSIEEVWNHERTVAWRNTLLNNDRNCPIFNLMEV